MSKREIVVSEKAPKAIGPYSQGIRTECFIFSAGQLGLSPTTGELAEGGVQAETRQALQNLHNVLAAAGSGMERRAMLVLTTESPVAVTLSVALLPTRFV